MKILHIITQSVVGGAQSVVIELSNSFIGEGHEVYVMSKPDGAMWQLLDSSIQKVFCEHFRRNISPVNEIKSFFAIRKAIKTINPDIIHLHTSKVGALGRLAAFPKYSKKTVYTMHGFDQVRISNKKFLPIEKLLKKACKKIVAISNYDKKNLELHGIKNLSLIPNATKDTRFLKKDTVIQEKIQLVANDKRIVMCVARDAEPKRFDLFTEIAKKLPQYCFMWIGNKNDYENLPENMHCLGEVPMAAAYIGLADLFILPTDHEGFGLSIVEAFSSGVPAIASNVGGIPEVIDNSCGYFLENNADLFVEKIKEVLEDTEKLDKLKINARKKYEENFTIGKMKNAYLELYSS